LEEVMRSGTAAGARGLGFVVPAAGKTGTSHDGWFAGFTSELLCIVWVGFDDSRQLDLEGARSALPIWTELMKRALLLRQYRSAKPFAAPEGVVSISIPNRVCPPLPPARPPGPKYFSQAQNLSAPAPFMAATDRQIPPMSPAGIPRLTSRLPPTQATRPRRKACSRSFWVWLNKHKGEADYGFRCSLSYHLGACSGAIKLHG
jgi:membrane peptidoglycan carboxypeptidase